MNPSCDAPDPSATLEPIRDRAGVFAKLGPPRPEIRDAVSVAACESAADVPALVAALEGVLKAHRPSTTDGRCCWCRDADGQRSAFPCGEYLAIARELSGTSRVPEKEGGDAPA